MYIQTKEFKSERCKPWKHSHLVSHSGNCRGKKINLFTACSSWHESLFSHTNSKLLMQDKLPMCYLPKEHHREKLQCFWLLLLNVCSDWSTSVGSHFWGLTQTIEQLLNLISSITETDVNRTGTSLTTHQNKTVESEKLLLSLGEISL